MIIDNVPNDAPPVECVWMFVSRDKDGQENVIGGYLNGVGIQPLMTGNPRILDLMLIPVRELAKSPDLDGRTIHLLKFTCREEVEDWR